MRRLLATLTIMVACGVVAADDSDAQAAMRKAVKSTKISVDWKDALMQEVAKELAEKLEDAGKVKNAKCKVDSITTGLTQNMKVSLTVKDKTVAEVLDELGKKYMLGYVILGKDDPKSKYKSHKKADGTLLITKGDKERGDPKD